MSIVQTYVLVAAAGHGAALHACLRGLANIDRELEGCEGVTILRDLKKPGRYVVMETFADAAAHEASGAHVPKPLLAEMMRLLSEKPQTMTLAAALDG